MTPVPLLGNLPLWVAHTPSKTNPHWHCLEDHELAVTRLAEDFAAAFGGAALARYVGLLHDLGKFTPEFQQYLKDCAAGVPRKPGSAPHKQHGAQAALTDLTPILGEERAKLLAAVIHGHHGGMQRRDDAKSDSENKAAAKTVLALRAIARAAHADLDPTPPAAEALLPLPHANDTFSYEMFLRMVFSALTDADGLDTEAHNDPGAAARRAETPLPTLPVLRDALRARQEKDFAGKTGMVNAVRREVYDACCQAAVAHAPGIFALSVPTGGGKTRSSLAFSLEHAVRHDLHRVIYAIPYTSIVDQTAGVFRDVLGGGDAPGVLEHHSAIDTRQSKIATEDGEQERVTETERWRLLAAQNWDAPVIVTTTVQLLESLFSNRPGACRKLHRLARSVIVLDEVQTLPATLLEPILSGLKTLVENFGATVVLCTATQPALSVQSEFLSGFAQITPLVPDEQAKRHFEELRRVCYQVELEPWTWEQVAGEMRAENQSCLCIVNTRKQALALMDVLESEGEDRRVLHLSTLLCGKHRRRTLRKIRLCLRCNVRILVVSTQVVEAGVDLDFPKVLRAVGPLDRIIQAAGRCNREGLRPRSESRVIVFTPTEGGAPPGVYQMALEKTVQLFRHAQARGEEVAFDDPAFVTRYFARLFRDMAGNVDKEKIQLDRQEYDYPSVARKMRLIEDDTISVFIKDYDPAVAQKILAEAQAMGRMTRRLWQRAQPLCVSIYASDMAKELEEPVPGLRLWPEAYHPKRGIPLMRDPADAIIHKAEALMA